MDYNELSRDVLIGILEDKNIEYNDNLTDEGLIDLLENSSSNDENIQTVNEYSSEKRTGFAYGAATFNIIMGVITAVFLFWMIFPLIFGILAATTNNSYKNGKNNKVSAGVWALLSGNLLGAILVWCS